MAEEVRIAPADPLAATRFATERELILPCFPTPPLAIEHFGSTAVPGLAAKPIIDIMVLVADLAEGMAARPALEQVGYAYSSGPPERPRIVFIKGVPLRTHHLHIHADADEFRRHMIFRDQLRLHAEDRAAYEALKHDLAARFRTDRVAYADAKSDFIDAIVARSGGPARK